ncbi:MAG: M48 family metalloprotease [Bacteroidota bacterium]
MKKHVFACLVAAAAFVMLPACVRNPVTGKKEVSFMSNQQEMALGAQSDPSIVASFGLYDDPAIQKFIEEKGMAMAKLSHRPELEWKFRILDSPVVNAFAVPGGYIYFTRGIMAHFNNEAEFAGVLGHEIGHVTARHSARQYTKQTLGQIGLIAGLILSPDFREYAEQASQGMQLLFLKFSRDHESQSDALGVQYSTQAGYDAREMADFFHTLERLSANPNGERLPEFLSTHPDPANRFENVGKMAEEWQAKPEYQGKSFTINRDSYLKMIDGMIYGDDPKQGYVDNFVFYHPELKFQYNVPRNWKTVNSPQQVQMATEDGKAMMVLTLAQGDNMQQAAQKFAEEHQLTVVDSRQTTVNGLSALAVVSDQIPQQQQGQQYQQSAANQPTVATNQSSGSGSGSGSSSSAPPTRQGGGTTTNSGSSGSGKVITTRENQNQPSDKSTGNTGSTSTNNGKSIPQSPSNQNQPAPSQNQPAPQQSGAQPTLRVYSYYITYNKLIYVFHGISKFEDQAKYKNAFLNSMRSFKVLTDPARINVKPERLKIVPVKANGTFQAALNSYGITSKRHKEFSIVNGMELGAAVRKGNLIKIVEK